MVESTNKQPPKKSKKKDKKHDEQLASYLDRMEVKEEKSLIREEELAKHIAEVKAEKKARKLEKKRKLMVTLNQEQFDNYLKNLNEKHESEHYLEWNEKLQHVTIKCKEEGCHFQVSFHYSSSKEFIDRPDTYRKVDPEKFFCDEKHDH